MKKSRILNNSRIPFALASAIAAMLATQVAHAQAGTWNVDANGLWSLNTNWLSNTIANGNTANFTNNITADRTVSLDSARTITGLVFGDSNTATAGSWILDNNGNAANTLTGLTAITVNALGTGKTATISAVIAGSASRIELNGAGGGTLVLAGANTFNFATNNANFGWRLNAGSTVVIASDSAFGVSTPAAFDYNASTLVNLNGGTLQASGSARTVANPIWLNGSTTVVSGSESLTFSGATMGRGGNPTVTNNITGAGTLSFTGNVYTDQTTGFKILTFNGTGNTLISGNISNNTAGTNTNGSITKSGVGKLTLSGTNTYSGPTAITEGVLQLGNGGTTGRLSTSSAITNNANFTINRSNAVIQGTDFSTAAITGSGAFTQAGAGTTTLNAANTYTGTTNVNGGTLRINGNQTSANGAVSIASGATLGGSGTIGGAVTVNAGGFHAAGNSIGTQTMLAGYTQNGTEQVELGTAGASPAAGLSDRTVVTGTLNLGGSSTLQLIDNAGADGNGSMGAGAYRLITFTGTRTGSFNTVTNPLSATLHEKVVYGSGTVDLELYRLATANTITTPVNLGNVRVGGTFGTSALSIQNTAAATFSEGLNATQGSTTGSASVSGTDITNLAGGASSSTISVGLGGNANTGTAGAKTGTVALGLTSNGTNSGYANTSLTGQTITVNGAVYNPASAAASQTVTTLNTRVNASVSSSMSITNTGAASAPYQETLGTTGFSATSSGFTATGSATGIATSSSGSLTVGMDANAVAGAYSGSTTLGLQTEEVNSSGLGNLGIASQTVNINVNVYNFAQALLSQSGGAGTLTGLNLDFGGGLQLNTDYIATLQFANTAFGNAAFQDTLSGNYTGFTGTGFSTTAANFSGVAADGFNSFTITFNTGSVGTFTGSINMTGNSDEAAAGLGSLALGMQTINFTATTIPEPNVAALLGSLGLLALLRRRR